MKNLSRTIDQIIKLDPTLEDRLIPIKNKHKKAPARVMSYWKDLLKVLNSDDLMTHPKRSEIKNILTPAKRPVHKVCSFDEVVPSDKVLGVIPEHIADRIARHDRVFIQMSKQHTEAALTKNMKMMIELARRNAKQEIDLKKIWFDIKDHFGLWDCSCNYAIKTKDGIIVLAAAQESNDQSQGPGQGHHNGPSGGMLMMDPNSMRNFLRMLGLDQGE